MEDIKVEVVGIANVETLIVNQNNKAAKSQGVDDELCRDVEDAIRKTFCGDGREAGQVLAYGSRYRKEK